MAYLPLTTVDHEKKKVIIFRGDSDLKKGWDVYGFYYIYGVTTMLRLYGFPEIFDSEIFPQVFNGKFLGPSLGSCPNAVAEVGCFFLQLHHWRKKTPETNS